MEKLFNFMFALATPSQSSGFSVRNEDFKRFLVELNMFNFISRNFFQLFIVQS